MAYPESINKFTEKLNKLDNNTYVIEEEIQIKDGVYEGELEHDNVSLPSINVYTGLKLTGNKVENVIVSTPSLTPWKTHIKIFSDVSPVYVTYQTTGDTVEADDINKVQDSVVNTQKEVDRYKTSNDNRVLNDEVRLTTVENNKAEKTYVDTELNKRYTKDVTYTKTETDQRIQMVIDAAPEALDTLKEIANALNNDPNFAATITTQLSKKVDKVEGKQLSTEDYTATEKSKLAGIEDGANKYIHPATHPGNMITEDSTHRWSTDTEKFNWNDANSKKHVHNNLTILQTITQTLIDAWNSAVDHISDTVKHITSAERTLWNTVSNKVDKVSGKGLSTNDFDNSYKSKVDGIEDGATKVEDSTINGNVKINGTEKIIYTHPGSGTNPHGTTKSDIGLSGVTNDAQVKRVEMGVANGVATLDVNGINAQAPKKHSHSKSDITDFPSTLPASGGTSSFLGNAVNVPDYNALNPNVVAQGNITPIKAPNTANAPWNNTTSGLLIQSNDSDSFHILIFRSGGDGWAYRSYYQGTWAGWQIFSTKGFGGAGENIKILDGVDLNTVRTTGNYLVKNPTNSPDAGWSHLEVFSYDDLTQSTRILQIYKHDTRNKIYYRQNSNSAWSAWVSFANFSDIPTKVSQLSNDSKFVTQTELGNAGYGDMMKSAYDKDNDGVIDKAASLNRIDITGQTVDLNGVTLSDGTMNKYYINKTNGGSANISNIPVLDTSFILDVELIRYVSEGDYIAKQTFTSGPSKNTYERFYTSGTWSSWSIVLTSTKKCTWNDLKGV
ncbi:pyocin knob domain-containing protein [Clostridium tyrobutyricum]|uniref:pyocin knob domain-containing protein n=1 Tax=Clostridium tyrobutyricum TaxID=1519 RepID=UPI001C38A4EA|nr:pyocin knob domain-containing protein [Clostridium tyrobutyricum]MBV4423251.1 pyocin knob domain-containing protein [Clostridium tyrobutyricum]